MSIYLWIIVFSWIAFLFYWMLSSRGVKKDVQYGSQTLRYFSIVLIVLAVLISNLPYFQGKFFPDSLTVNVVADILCVGGIAFAIWARWHLGKNWSPVPAIKEGHELITSGPYRFVRHPIYTGIIFAILGSVLIAGKVWILMLIAIIVMFVWRVKTEEEFMMKLFPNQYPEYKKRTKALIPFIW